MLPSIKLLNTPFGRLFSSHINVSTYVFYFSLYVRMCFHHQLFINWNMLKFKTCDIFLLSWVLSLAGLTSIITLVYSLLITMHLHVRNNVSHLHLGNFNLTAYSEFGIILKILLFTSPIIILHLYELEEEPKSTRNCMVEWTSS